MPDVVKTLQSSELCVKPTHQSERSIMESDRIYPIDSTFISYPIAWAVNAERKFIEPSTIDCVVTMKAKRLFGGYRIFPITVSEDTFLAVEARLKSAKSATTP